MFLVPKNVFSVFGYTGNFIKTGFNDGVMFDEILTLPQGDSGHRLFAAKIICQLKRQKPQTLQYVVLLGSKGEDMVSFFFAQDNWTIIHLM